MGTQAEQFQASYLGFVDEHPDDSAQAAGLAATKAAAYSMPAPGIMAAPLVAQDAAMRNMARGDNVWTMGLACLTKEKEQLMKERLDPYG